MVAKAAHPRGARSARGHFKKFLALKNLACYMVLNLVYNNAAKSRIYDGGVQIEPHNRQIYDTGVLVE